jgi:ribosomal-protein-alanine N-acetyltransferase
LLKESYWGRGLATQAAKALLEYGFCTVGLANIDSGASAENLASKRVMEKIGMTYVGTDENGGYCFTLSEKEYLQRARLDS